MIQKLFNDLIINWKLLFKKSDSHVKIYAGPKLRNRIVISMHKCSSLLNQSQSVLVSFRFKTKSLTKMKPGFQTGVSHQKLASGSCGVRKLLEGGGRNLDAVLQIRKDLFRIHI